MATLPVMDNWTAGEAPSAAKMNKNIRDTANFLLSAPYTHVELSVAQSIPTGAFTDIVWNVEVADNDATYTSGANVVVKTAGVYLITASMGWALNTTGVRMARITTAGGEAARVNQAPIAGFDTLMNISTFARLSVGQAVTLSVYQNSGVALNTSTSASSLYPRLQVLWQSA